MLIYTPFMIIGYLIIPMTLTTVFGGLRSSFSLSILAGIYSILYAWIFIIPAVLIFDIPFWSYFVADIPFTIILAASSILTTAILYRPLEKFIRFYFDKSNLL